MAKFLILYNSSQKAEDLMAQATREQMEASMKEWREWADQANKTVKFDFGMPLQAVGRLTPSGQVDSDSQVGGYSMIEADSRDQVLEVLKNHPQLKRPGSYIEVLEVVAMPGLPDSEA